MSEDYAKDPNAWLDYDLEKPLKATLLHGEVVPVDANPARPGEAAKQRPAVVASNDLFNAYAPVVVVVPPTSKVDCI